MTGTASRDDRRTDGRVAGRLRHDREEGGGREKVVSGIWCEGWLVGGRMKSVSLWHRKPAGGWDLFLCPGRSFSPWISLSFFYCYEPFMTAARPLVYIPCRPLVQSASSQTVLRARDCRCCCTRSLHSRVPLHIPRSEVMESTVCKPTCPSVPILNL